MGEKKKGTERKKMVETREEKNAQSKAPLSLPHSPAHFWLRGRKEQQRKKSQSFNCLSFFTEKKKWTSFSMPPMPHPRKRAFWKSEKRLSTEEGEAASVLLRGKKKKNTA